MAYRVHFLVNVMWAKNKGQGHLCTLDTCLVNYYSYYVFCLQKLANMNLFYKFYIK